MELEIIRRVIIGIMLSIQSYWDIKDRAIPTSVSILGGVFGLLFSIYEERELVHLLAAFVPGILCLFFCKISKEAVGYGDAIVFLVLGLFYSLEGIVSICMAAYSVAGILALILLVFFHKNKNYEIPFIPFVWIGWGVEFLLLLGAVYV